MSPKIMCSERQNLENELTEAGAHKRAAEKLFGARNRDAGEEAELTSVQNKYNDVLRKIHAHEIAVAKTKCGCII